MAEASRSVSENPSSTTRVDEDGSAARRTSRGKGGSVVLSRSAFASEISQALSRVPIDKPVRHHGTVHVLDSRCKECEFCVVFCPKEVLEISDRYTSAGYRPARVKAGKEADCIACGFCEDVCPEYAIYVVEDSP